MHLLHDRGVALVAAVALLCLSAVLGIHFSPGFSEWYVGIFMIIGAISLLHADGGKLFLPLLLSLAAVLLWVGCYVYAAGDDWLDRDVWISVGSAAVLYALLQRGRKAPLPEHLARFLLLLVGLFALFCGVSSTALLPVGIGTLLFAADRILQRRGILAVFGLVLCSLFLLMPMIPGGAL